MNTPTTPARVRMVDQWNAPTLKFNGREPRTLVELEYARAEYQYRNRLATIKAMAKKLALLEEHLPAIEAAGIRIPGRDISFHDQTLWLSASIFTPDDKLHQVLLGLGFKEMERRDFCGKDSLTLRHGRWLQVRIEVSKVTPPTTPTTHSDSGARA